MSSTSSHLACCNSRSSNNPKLKNVSYFAKGNSFFNYIHPKRINTSSSKARDAYNKNTRHKRNSSRDNKNKQSYSYVQNDYSYYSSSDRSKGNYFCKSPYNCRYVNNMYNVCNTSRGLSESASYRHATPQYRSNNNFSKQLVRSSSTAQQLLTKRNYNQYTQQVKQSEKKNANVKVYDCVYMDNSQFDTNRMNTQSSCFSNSCTFSQNSLFGNSYANVNSGKGKKTSITKTKESSSQNSNANTTSSKGRDKNYMDVCINKIETPEELHFFYVHVLQNGKQYENNF